ncbi:alpha/beta hydrolase [Streptomyces rochei]|uniref:alpha/beta hydrolase n=1 Tax=Streptomyces rochei TaxID=1928 RepID=UPI00339F77D4
MPTHPRPPFAPEAEAALTALAEPMPAVTPGAIPVLRQAALPVVSDETLLAAGVTRRDVTVPGHHGAELVASVIARSGHTGTGPGIYHVHGGGMIVGERMIGVSQILPWIVEHDAVAVTVEYRLAPEFPDPCPVEDCYAGLVWTAEHAAELGIDPGRLSIAGASAGGGLAAGTALLARDRKGPALIGQVLICPMLDDRDRTVSSTQYEDAAYANALMELRRAGRAACMARRLPRIRHARAGLRHRTGSDRGPERMGRPHSRRTVSGHERAVSRSVASAVRARAERGVGTPGGARRDGPRRQERPPVTGGHGTGKTKENRTNPLPGPEPSRIGNGLYSSPTPNKSKKVP